MLNKQNIIFFIFSLLLILPACTTINNDSTDSTEKNATNETEHTSSDTSSSIQTEATASFPDIYLQKGDAGESVEALQKALKKVGYNVEVTARFDKQTTWAITDFQLQQESLFVTGIYDDKTKNGLKEVLENNDIVEAGLGLAPPEHPNELTAVIENPYEILAVINKKYALPHDYIPSDLVIPNVRFPFTEDVPKKQLRRVAADALEQLFAAADKAGLNLFAQSGYRSYERQETIFTSNVQKHGEKSANTFSAKPGQSEHQSGLSMDVTSPEVKFQLTIAFGDTKEGQWLVKHASEFGYIIRYPEGKETITQYQYEPWHLRYVGKKAATEIMEKSITLEEYLDIN
ncbi:D-alanyl-D-alanine carboxypeptidase family protein [Virgibacillus sp. W0430]|uniref:D-alanyl-D-alanine carboxypeptidase family protein n=1 Tax=Virgibacillus sp. W0430 TaxID=3391580 RepID=UPI003F44B25D